MGEAAKILPHFLFMIGFISSAFGAAGGEATRIVSPVGNVTVFFGGDAVLSCVVDDLGYGEVSWVRGETVMTRNDKVLMDDARIQVSSDGRNWSLRIGRVSPEDVGCYACKVETRESVGCLVVQKSPDIVDDESSGDLTVNKGEDARLSCRARGNPPPKIQWRREDGRDILQIRPDDSRGRDYLISVALGIPYGNWTRSQSVEGEILELLDIQKGQAGTYLCTASNGVPPAVSKRIRVIVRYMPLGEKFWTGVGAKTGEAARLECTVSGFPKPKILWTFNGTPLNGSTVEEEELEVGVGAEQETRWRQTLKIPSVEDRHYGLYNCLGINELGNFSSFIRLHKIYSTTTSTARTPVRRPTALWGGLNPSWMSWTPPTLDDNDDSDWLQRHLVSGRTPSLRRTPSVPSNAKARALSSTSLMIQWDKPTESSLEMTYPLTHEVHYTSNPILETAVWSKQVASGNNFTIVSGLTPFTVYTIRVNGHNAYGPGLLSPSVQVKTQLGVPSQPLGLASVLQNATSIQLKWERPEFVQVPIINYELYWHDTYTDEVQCKSIPVKGEYVLTDLYPDNEYKIWLAAKSKSDEGAPTPPITVSTKNYVIHEPEDVVVEVVNFTSAIVRWKPPKQKEQHRFIVGYRISTQEMDDLRKPIGEPLVHTVQNRSTLTFLLTDLQPDSKYEVRVAAFMRQGFGKRNSPIVLQTPGGVPSRPKLKLVDVETVGAAIEATWENPSKTFGKIQGWRLRYGKRPNSYNNDPKYEEEKLHMTDVTLDQPDANKHDIRNLDYGREYEFRLACCNDVGCGQEAIALIRIPEKSPAGPPTNISFHHITANSIAISWEDPVPSQCNGRILGYKFQLHKFNDYLVSERNVSSPKMIVKGLEENIPYHFRICAYNGKGVGPFSEKIHLDTTLAPRAPRNVKAMATSEDTLEVWWDEVPRESIAGYRIFYSVADTENPELWKHKDVLWTSSVHLQNLVQSSEYSIQVAVRTKVGGLGRLSEALLVKVTPEDVPMKLRSPFVGNDYMYLRWESPNAFVPYKYKVSFDAVKEFVNENGTTQTEVIPARVIYLNRTDTSYTLHGLSPFTTYRVNVSAIPPKKDYRPPASIYVTTDMHAPPSLATPKLYGVTDSGTIMVILPQASQEFGPISHYFLVVIPESQVANLTDPNAYHLSYDAVETSTSLFTELPPESRPYIAAKFIGQDVPYIFNLGDHQTFNGYLNRPLFKSRRYKVFLRAYVDSPSEPHLFGTSNMSSFLSLDMNPIPPGAIPSDRLISTATVLPPAQSGGSLWVIGPVTLALLLASSLAVFMYVRRRRTLRSGQGASTTFEPLVSSDAPVATPDLNELH